MRHHIVAISCAAVAFVVLSTAAFAAEGGGAASGDTKPAGRVTYTLADAPDLQKQVTAVCLDANVKLTDKARKACESHDFPKLTSKKNFRAQGIGGEFATLIRQKQ